MFPDLGSQYKFIKEIGRGGSGIVYLALDRYSGFLVCVKKLLDEHSKNEEFLIKFKSEANIYLMLNHPNIVKVHESQRSVAINIPSYLKTDENLSDKN